jgi:hypothetical protein
MTRFFAFSVLICISLTLSWPFFILASVVYAFWYEGVELILIGFLLDAYLGTEVPWLPFPAAYTFALMGILMSVWGLKPLLLIERNESIV